MNRLSGIWLQGFVWMATIMLPIQPLAAGYCSCCHFTAASAAAGDNSDAKHISCGARRCGCSAKQAEQGLHPKVPLAPCECPPSCPCHLQHVPKVALKTQEARVQRCDPVVLYVDPEHWPAVTNEIRQALVSLEHDVILSETALELCAALCRFTI